VRAMRDAGIRPLRPVEVVCTADEEGRFGGMLGSQAICGEIGPDWIAAAVDDSGNRLSDALLGRGLDPNGAAARRMEDVGIFLELHVEQGPVLEQSGRAVGIVDAISGVFNWTVTLSGEANHSGTTPMPGRRDAFRGLADFGAAIPGILAEAGGPDTRLTVGMVALRPNFPHSIAGEAVFSIIGRDTDERVMRHLAETCRSVIERVSDDHSLDVRIAEQSWLAPTVLDPSVRADLEAIASACGIDAITMSSGAGHDAQTFARHCPAGLIFVPSVGGVSHSPEESTEWRDIERGTLLLANAIRRYATAEPKHHDPAT
ncbi:MAG TPA: Zn-dependent hydrolase, partial [Paracoccaceae bacterium]|nr:Zn-dependent hydrolase [Paracoccaceae bacterium]